MGAQRVLQRGVRSGLGGENKAQVLVLATTEGGVEMLCVCLALILNPFDYFVGWFTTAFH